MTLYDSEWCQTPQAFFYIKALASRRYAMERVHRGSLKPLEGTPKKEKGAVSRTGRTKRLETAAMRGEAISDLLRLPGAFELRAVAPDGDCFYNAVSMQLPRHRQPALKDAASMRALVADSLTDEVIGMYKMYAAAGVEDFSWLNHHRSPSTTEEIRAFARKCGHDAGASGCRKLA